MTHEPAPQGSTAWEVCDARVTQFAKFARAHLRNPAQRAVYLALAGAPDEVWSAESVSERGNLELHEVDVALRRFAAAGIAETAGRAPSGEQLYRWHPTMAYLHHPDDGPGIGAVDPVCGMPVPTSTSFTETADGQVQRFCSLRCQTAWRVAAREFSPS